MNQFDRDFDKQFKQMKRGFGSAVALMAVYAIFSLAVTLGILGFIGWVIIKLMQHFQVI